jgi:hypothetical protein
VITTTALHKRYGDKVVVIGRSRVATILAVALTLFTRRDA